MTSYTEAEKEAYLSIIYTKLGEGRFLAPICRAIGLPYNVVEDWVKETNERLAAYKRARQTGFDVTAEDCIRIADDKTIAPDRARVMIDTRFRLLARVYPEKYGETALLVLKNHDDNAAVSSAEDLAALLQAALFKPAGALPAPLDAEWSEVDES